MKCVQPDDQVVFAAGLRRALSDPPSCEWRSVEIDVGQDEVRDELLDVAERYPIRLLVRGERRHSDRVALRESAVDVCEIAPLSNDAASSAARLDELLDLGSYRRAVGIRLEPQWDDDRATAAEDQDRWGAFIQALRCRVPDLELVGGATAASITSWENPEQLLPWTNSLRRAWDRDLLGRIRQWETETMNPTEDAHWRMVFSHLVASVRPALDVGGSGRLADICGGMGFASRALLHAGAVAPYRAHVFDIDEVAVSKGLRLRDVSAHFRVADALHLPTGDGTFDAALVVGAIDYFCKDESQMRLFLLECARILKPGSPLVVAHPLFWVTSSAQLFAQVLYPEVVAILGKALREQGFEIEHRTVNGTFLSAGVDVPLDLNHLPTNRARPPEREYDEIPIVAYIVARLRR